MVLRNEISGRGEEKENRDQQQKRRGGKRSSLAEKTGGKKDKEKRAGNSVSDALVEQDLQALNVGEEKKRKKET